MPDLTLPEDDAPEEFASGPTNAKGNPRRRETRVNEGRPSFEPTDAHRHTVTVWRGIGVDPPDIARQIGCSENTLYKHFREEMEHGLTTLRTKMGSKIVSLGLDGNVQALVFYLKNHGGPGWEDKQRHQHSGPDGKPIEFREIRRIIVDAPPTE